METLWTISQVIMRMSFDVLSPKHCDICHQYLYEECKEKNLFGRSKEHYIVPFRMRGCTSKSPEHFINLCRLYCENFE